MSQRSKKTTARKRGPTLGRSSGSSKNRAIKKGAPPPNPTVGYLIDRVAAVFNLEPNVVVDEIARMAAPQSGESDPSRETILSYIKDRRMIDTGGRQLARSNRETPCRHKFAHLVANYLEGRRPNRQRINLDDFVAKRRSWNEARALCKEVLRNERDRRFERPLGSDPGTLNTILGLVGVYATCRRESKDNRYRQELLILRNVGTRRVPRCYCTFISNDVVVRGEWIVVGSLMYCNMTGHRSDNAHDVVGMYLAQLSNDHDVMSGFLAGLGTEVKVPVAMPIVAIKLIDVDKSIQELGDLGDHAILKAYRQVNADLSSVEERLHKILTTQMSPVIFRASAINPQILNEFQDGKLLVAEGIKSFCRLSLE